MQHALSIPLVAFLQTVAVGAAFVPWGSERKGRMLTKAHTKPYWDDARMGRLSGAPDHE
jgi:hypothetical protein